jgi:hypothetical protein
MIYTLNNILNESIKNNPVKISKLIKAANKWKQYKLEKDITLKLSNDKIIAIPKGFEWDLSSVPKIFWSILPPDGDFIIGALIHDYLYQNKMFTRSFADREMYLWNEAVNKTIKLSLKRIDNKIRYIGVRLFGNFVWNKNK